MRLPDERSPPLYFLRLHSLKRTTKCRKLPEGRTEEMGTLQVVQGITLLLFTSQNFPDSCLLHVAIKAAMVFQTPSVMGIPWQNFVGTSKTTRAVLQEISRSFDVHLLSLIPKPRTAFKQDSWGVLWAQTHLFVMPETRFFNVPSQEFTRQCSHCSKWWQCPPLVTHMYARSSQKTMPGRESIQTCLFCRLSEFIEVLQVVAVEAQSAGRVHLARLNLSRWLTVVRL